VARDLRNLIVAELEDAKGEDIVVIDLAGKSDIADFMVIASGRSERQLAAMSARLSRHFKDAGMGSVPIEGERGGEWFLIDAGDVIVHLFRPEIRELYNLEKMWALALPAQDADSIEVSGSSAR
jgi:ribosome-associated protein